MLQEKVRKNSGFNSYMFSAPVILSRPNPTICARAPPQLVADASLWDCRLLVFCEGPYAHLCSNIGTATEATGVASGTVVTGANSRIMVN